jgi:hypothetical protein
MSVDPYPDPESRSGSGTRRENSTHRNWKNLDISFFEVLNVLFSELKASSVA